MKRFLPLLSLPIILGISGCNQAVPQTPFEAYLHNEASPRIQEAYAFAVSHPGDLEYQPCYCGCRQAGHTSNLSCFAKSVSPEGQFTYDSHAAGCDLCLDIALDVKRLKGEGLSALEIRHYIDAQYSSLGPATDTPMPEF